MTDFQRNAERRDGRTHPAAGKDKKPISMHENVSVWCDCCSCEAEPYWVAVAEELGIDLEGPKESGQDR